MDPLKLNVRVTSGRRLKSTASVRTTSVSTGSQPRGVEHVSAGLAIAQLKTRLPPAIADESGPVCRMLVPR